MLGKIFLIIGLTFMVGVTVFGIINTIDSYNTSEFNISIAALVVCGLIVAFLLKAAMKYV